MHLALLHHLEGVGLSRQRLPQAALPPNPRWPWISLESIKPDASNLSSWKLMRTKPICIWSHPYTSECDGMQPSAPTNRKDTKSCKLHTHINWLYAEHGCKSNAINQIVPNPQYSKKESITKKSTAKAEPTNLHSCIYIIWIYVHNTLRTAYDTARSKVPLVYPLSFQSYCIPQPAIVTPRPPHSYKTKHTYTLRQKHNFPVKLPPTLPHINKTNASDI